MTKNILDGRVENTLTAEKPTSLKCNTTDFWKNYGYFKQKPWDFCIEKANLPENSIIYINQGYQSYKDNNKIFYADYYLLGQANHCLNQPEDLKNCEWGKNLSARIWHCQRPVLGLYETLGYLTVWGDSGE